ncbi:MAG: FliA/WhiG family RNA polymerase sigma factor [Deltaproteobacteria bacterium]
MKREIGLAKSETVACLPEAEVALFAPTPVAAGEALRPLYRSEGVAPGETPYDEETVRTHLPLVRQVVQRILPRKPPEVPIDDLISWGTLGLLDAMRKFDSDREASFSTYAQYRIKGSILDYLRRCDWLPRSMRQRAHDIDHAVSKLEREHGQPPSSEEIAKEMGVSLVEYGQITASLSAQTPIATADLAFGRGEEMLTSDEVLSDESECGPMKKVLRKQRVEILASAISDLPEKERIVVSFYYFEGLTMREMAEALSLTEGRISQLHSQAMLRLRGLLSDSREEICFGVG